MRIRAGVLALFLSGLILPAAGQASVAVTITGSSVAGSEFFDPGADVGGPGFANRISASVSGGVTVNSGRSTARLRRRSI